MTTRDNASPGSPHKVEMPAFNRTYGPRTRAEVLTHQRAHDFVVSV